MNITARLCSNAAAGEILVSQAAASEAGLTDERVEIRQISLKGKTEPVAVQVISVAARED